MKILYAEDERPLSEAVTDVPIYHKYVVNIVYRLIFFMDVSSQGQIFMMVQNFSCAIAELFSGKLTCEYTQDDSICFIARF